MSEAVIESNVEPTEWFGGHRTCLWGCVAVSLVFIGLRSTKVSTPLLMV